MTHRLADIGKRGAVYHATCACGQVFQAETELDARQALRIHIDSPEEGSSVVSLEEFRQGPPEGDGRSEAPSFACTEPGCDFVSTRVQGLSRHRNQTHGAKPAKTSTTKKRHTRHEAPPAALEAVGYQVVLTLDSEQTDVLAALAFVEERDADDLIRDAVTSWLEREVEIDPALGALAAARARRRA